MPSSRLAKLTRPRTDGLLARERLFQTLDSARERPLVWVSGPPGAGKTSLVSSYLEARTLDCLWYQCDPGDADPATFFYYLGIAASEAGGKQAKPLPLFTEDYAQDLAGFARRFFRALFAHMGIASVLVLDNYQEAGDAEAFHVCVRIALEEMPAGQCLFGVSRYEPPAAFARARANQQVSLITWEQLKLTEEETAAVAAEASPDPETIARIQEQSGGWAAGVVLMLERLRQTGALRPGSVLENLETIFDYFAGQVFEAAPKDTRDMLVRLAYLPRMTAATAEIVTGNPAVGTLLDTLARRNLFTDRRYGNEVSFQFHALFRTFLRERAREHLGVSEHQRLAHSVAALLQATGQIEDALQLFVEGSAWDAAARLVVLETEAMVRQGRRETLKRWVELLPMDIVNRDPALLYALGLAHFKSGADTTTTARHLLSRACEGFERTGDVAGQLRTVSAIAESYYTDPKGMAPLDPWIQRLQALLSGAAQNLPADLRARPLLNLSRSLLYRDPLDPSVSQTAERLRECLESEDVLPDARVLGRGFLLMHGWWRMDVSGNAALITATDPLLTSSEISETSWLSYLFYKANHLVTVGDYHAGLAIIAQALEITDDSGLSPLSYDFHRLAAQAFLYMRRYREGRERMVQHVIPNLSRQRATQRLIALGTAALAELGVGNRDAARRYLEALECDPEANAPIVGWLLAPTRGGLWAILGDVDRALGLLERVSSQRDIATAAPFVLGRALVGRAFVFMLMGRDAEAAAELRHPHLAPEPHSVSVWLGLPFERIPELYALALRHDIHTEFVSALIRNQDIPAPDPDLEHWPWPLRIRLLGRFCVEGALPRKAGKAQHKLNELLRAIAVRGPDGLNLQSLADELWPDSEGDAALNSAQVSLYRLRKLLGRDDTVRVLDGVVYLDRSVCWVDAWAFESKAREACSMPADAAGFEEVAHQTLSLYRRPLLPDDDELPGVRPMRQRLHRLWTDLVREQASRLAQSNRARDSVDLLERAFDLDPASDSLCRDLMRHHTKNGDTTQAVQAFERCRTALRDSLGIQPAAETQRLHREALGAGRQSVSEPESGRTSKL